MHILLGGIVGEVLNVVATGVTNLVTTGKVSLKKATLETATGMAILGVAGKVAKKVQVKNGISEVVTTFTVKYKGGEEYDILSIL